MQARVGDRLCVHGHTVGHGNHWVDVLEVRGAAGGPPYLVRYADGHEAVVIPGPDAVVEREPGSVGAGGVAPGTGTGTGVGPGGSEPTTFEPEEDDGKR